MTWQQWIWRRREHDSKTTDNNFAPRIGFAYKMLADRRLVIRGGFGVFYDLGYAYSGSAFSTEIFPFAASNNLSNVTFTAPEFSAQPTLNLSPPYQRVYAYSSDFKLPYSLEYNLTVEHGVGPRDTLSVAYVGATGRRLGRVESSVT